eukprot:COSAG01_NODE_2899_length_6893_cov_14.384898_3_plen_113_part_00
MSVWAGGGIAEQRAASEQEIAVTTETRVHTEQIRADLAAKLAASTADDGGATGANVTSAGLTSSSSSAAAAAAASPSASLPGGTGDSALVEQYKRQLLSLEVRALLQPALDE